MKKKKMLTRREKQILHLISLGESTNSIAESLFVSPETVKTHRKNMIIKVGARNVANLIRIAFEKKLLHNTYTLSNITFAKEISKETSLAIVA